MQTFQIRVVQSSDLYVISFNIVTVFRIVSNWVVVSHSQLSYSVSGKSEPPKHYANLYWIK